MARGAPCYGGAGCGWRVREGQARRRGATGLHGRERELSGGGARGRAERTGRSGVVVGLDFGEEAGKGDGAFDEPGVGAAGFGFELFAPVVGGAVEDDGEVAVFGAGFEFAEEDPPVHAGEGVVDDHAGEGDALVDEREGAVAGGNDLGGDAFAGEVLEEEVGSVGVVFDDQDGGL